MVRIVDDAVDQCISVIINIWVPECLVCVLITMSMESWESVMCCMQLVMSASCMCNEVIYGGMYG